MDEVGTPGPRQRRDGRAGLPHLVRIGGEPFQRVIARDQIKPAPRGLRALTGAGLGPERDDLHRDAGLRQRGCQIDRVGPDTADHVGCHQDAGAVHQAQETSSSGSEAGRSSWMSLKLVNCAR